jgi:hypothetical protein
MIVLAFAYTWVYNGFVLILAFAALYALAIWISERRLEWQPVVYTALGIVLGLVINPYFPRNILFAIDHLVVKINVLESIQVGGEWYAHSTDAWLRDSAGSLLVLVLGVLYPSFGTRPRDKVDTTLLFTALLTLFMTFISNRFIEYYPAFALLFCAAAWGRGGVDLLPLLPTRLRLRWLTAALGLIITIGAVAFYVRQAYRITAERTTPLSLRAGASAWLRENTPEGALVYNVYWENFPRLFYHNPHNTYVAGLDPTYLQLANPALWADYDAIRLGQIENPSSVILSEFGAEYVILSSIDEKLLPVLQDDPEAALVYEDADSMVWRLTPNTSTDPETD